MVQRVMIRLTTRRGGFQLLPELGSRFHQLDLHQSDEFTLLSVVAEALEEIPEAEIIRIEKRVDFSEQALYLTLYLKLAGEQRVIDLDGRVWREQNGISADL